jgi:SPP1 family predicted phage head-tail adaptor
MQAGRLNKRIVIVAPTAVNNEYMDDTPTWTQVARVWASIRPLRGQIKAIAQASTQTATATHEIRIRYGLAVRPGYHRIIYAATFAEPENYTTLSAERLRLLSANDFAALTTVSDTIGLTYTINDAQDSDMDHSEMVMTCTEVAI